MKFITFEPNQPQSFIFPATGPFKLPSDAGSLYPLPDGTCLYLATPQADSLALLKLVAGEEFAICLYNHGKVPEWNVWLAPSTEKARAAAEVQNLDLEAQLSASLKLVQGGGRKTSGEAERPYLAPTGTEGAASIPAPLPVPKRGPALAAVAGGGKRGTRPGLIPMDKAFKELTQIVVDALKDSGEQWSDEAKQGAVSTLFIAARQGWLAWSVGTVGGCGMRLICPKCVEAWKGSEDAA